MYKRLNCVLMLCIELLLKIINYICCNLNCCLKLLFFFYFSYSYVKIFFLIDLENNSYLLC